MIGVSFLLLLGLGILAFYLYCNWRIFEKAGREGWEGIIPIYSTYVKLKIVGKPEWWLVVMILVPIVGIIFYVWSTNMLSKSFGKDEGFTIGLVLLGFIFLPILAFGDAQYIGPYGDPEAFRAYQQQRTGSFDLEEGRFAR